MTGEIPLSSLRLRWESAPSILETEAVVLRVFPFSRTSNMVAWLTREGRRLVTSVKGAQRPDSPFLGQYDLFYRCALLYYARSRDGVHVARECEALARRDALRSNWRAERCASWFAALADLVADADAPAPGLYRLLDETLDALASCDGPPPPALFARYEARLLREAGLAPNFGSGPERGGVALRFDLAEGRSIGPDERSALAVRLPPGLPALFESLLPGGAPAAATASATSASLLRFLGLFIRFHLPDAPVAGRALAVESLGVL